MSGGRTIKKALMCEPLHFSVDYAINPWMKPGTVDKKKAQTEWKLLKKTVEDLQVKVDTIEQLPNVPDMVFSADQCLIKGRKAIMANFKYKERRDEGKPYADWLTKKGFSLYRLSGDEFFEGGDVMKFDEIIFLGTGFRSTKSAGKAISRILQSNVITLELVDSFFYHLDTALFSLDDKTAFYYEPAFSKESVLILKEMITRLIPLTKEEAFGFCANSTAVNGSVVMQHKNKSFRQKVEEFGYNAIEVDISEFIKAGGGVHCLLQIIS